MAVDDLYLDTNVLIDYYEGRDDGLRPLGEFALGVIREIISCRYFAHISSKTVSELEDAGFSDEEIKRMLEPISNKLTMHRGSNRLWKNSNQIAKERSVPRSDVLHALIAKSIGAIVVTQDKHFGELEDIVHCVRPEQL